MFKTLLSLSFASCLMISTAALAEKHVVDQLVKEALSKNPEIAAYEAEIEAAKAAHEVAGVMQNPEVSFGVGRNSISSPGNDSTGMAYSASFSQPIDWPGRRGLREAIADQDIALAELGLERFKFNLASRVRVLAQKIAANQNVSKASSKVSKRYDELRKTLGERRPAGVAPQLELGAIKAAAAVAGMKATEANVALRASVMELNRIAGLKVTEETEVSVSGFELKELPSDTALFRKAAEHNYDVRIKRSELEQQGYKVELAENERYPTFSVGPFMSQERAREDQTIVGLNVSVPFPMWDSGAAKVSSAKAKQTQAEVNLNLVQREVEARLAEAAMVFRTHQNRLQSSGLDGISSAAEEAERHYQLGGVPISTYITMQDKYLEAVEAVSNAKVKALEAGLRIEEMTGAPGSVVKLGKK